MKTVNWCAIGDSFTYLNDHPDETGFRVTEGYLSRTCRFFSNLQVNNIGINGSTTNDWITVELPEADVYTILLGTNDWHAGIPLGSDSDFTEQRKGTILGNLSVILANIRGKNPEAQIVVMNPVERGDFVYLLDPLNNAHGSYAEDQGRWLADVAEGIYTVCRAHGIEAVNLHDLCGFTPENVVKFKRVKTKEGYRNLPYPDYVGLPINYEEDEYPYPVEAANLTYDGLHPSDIGNQVIAEIFAAALEKVLGERLKKE